MNRVPSYALGALALAGMLATLVPDTAQAGTSALLRFPATYRTWTITDADGGETTVSQFHVPLVTSVHISPGADLVFSTSTASADLEEPGKVGVSLQGNSDVTAQLFYRVPGTRLMLQGGSSIPAGKKELTPTELRVARALSTPLLGFPLKQYGQGLDLSAGLSVAAPLSPAVSIGVGASYLIHGEYRLVDQGDDFKPGPEMAVTAGLDIQPPGHPGSMIRLDGVYRLYQTDELGGTEIFEEGNQIELQAEATLPLGRAALTGLVRTVLKSDNTTLSLAGDTVEDITAAAGTSFLTRMAVTLPIGSSLRGGLLGEFGRFDGSELAEENGSAFGIGPVVSIALGGGSAVRLGGMYLTGTLETTLDEPDEDLSGLAGFLTFSWRGGDR